MIAKKPKAFVVGVVAQYVIMPLAALGLALAFQLPPELLVGVVLVVLAALINALNRA